MNLLKSAAVGAAIVYLSYKIADMDAVKSMSPTVAQYAPYLAGGALFVAAKHFNLA